MDLNTPSAIVDRQMLPRQTKSTEIFSGIVAAREGGAGAGEYVVELCAQNYTRLWQRVSGMTVVVR